MHKFARHAWAGLLLLGTAGSAFAADLPPEPLPVLPPEPVIFDTGGWYLRGDVGYAWYNQGDYWQTEAAAAHAVWSQETSSDAGLIGIGVGYKFNPWFRADATIGYRFDSDVSGYVANSYGYNVWKGSVNGTLLLANGYIDLGTWSGFTPYIGAGIGAVNLDSSWTPRFGTADGGSSSWNFAWALMAGVSYAFSPNFAIDIGYRYVNLGETSTGAFRDCCGGVQSAVTYKDISSNDVLVGLRWTFASGMPAPVPYEPPPIVRKY